MQGAPPLASPALDRLRHLQSLPSWYPAGGLPPALPARPLPLWCPAGGLPSLSPAYPAFSFSSCPLSPRPALAERSSPPGKGETFSLFCRGLRPRHPCIKPPAALTEPAVVVPCGGLAPGVAGSAGVNGTHGWRGGWDAALVNSAGSQGEGGPGERNFGV